jgi:uncharacterized lipoprotein YddW (UPF0748 family)
MRVIRQAAVIFLILFPGIVISPAVPQTTRFKGRGVWAGPRDAGTTDESVIRFVEQLHKAHINTVIMELKAGAGLCWPSTEFPEAVVPQYKDFDMPALLIRECHRRGIQVHAWFFDFAEGADSYVTRQHPEWLALNPEGKPTTSEILRGRPYRLAWMCPARRPGYTDQYLIPVIKDFVKRYDVDAIHHGRHRHLFGRRHRWGRSLGLCGKIVRRGRCRIGAIVNSPDVEASKLLRTRALVGCSSARFLENRERR